ncbi:MAG: PAS domain S-box protein, partial [Deltaproteobacteria bacterium]|nr:PAS domain S-box protein [Deltaproteobacteria bacterium]
DLREQKRTTQESEYRGRLLQTMNNAADILFMAYENNVEKALEEGMELMAERLGIDRVSIWRNRDSDGDGACFLHGKWANSLGRQGEPLARGEKFPFSAKWEESLRKHEYVNARFSNLPRREQDLLRPYNVQAILIIPIFLQGSYWGQVCFADCREERVFTEIEVSILHSASLMMVNAVNRNEEAAIIREANERTRLLLDSTPLCCQLLDKKFRTFDCNEAAVKLYGMANKQEYIARFFEFFPEFQPDGQQSLVKAGMYVEKAFAEGRVVFDWMHQLPDGKPLPSEVTLVRVEYGDEQVVAAYTRDRREYAAKEEAARESERRLTVMLDTMIFACFFFDLAGNLLDCNRRAVEIFGCENKEELLRDFWAFSPQRQPDGDPTLDKVAKIIRSTMECGKNVFFWSHVKKNGALLPTETTVVRVPWNNGHRLISYTHDMSGIVETEDKLTRVLAMTEASPDFAIFLGADGKIEYMNPAVSRISGHSRADLLVAGLSLLFSPEDFESLNTVRLPLVQQESRPIGFEMSLIAKNGERYAFSFSIFSLLLRHGGIGIGMMGRDITELTRMQQELRTAKEQAEQALTHEIQYHTAKGNLLSRVSHELRTPLNAIIGTTSIVEKANEKKELNRHFSSIKTSSEHLLGIVNDILDMTGFDTGRFDFTPRPFSFGAAMRRVVDQIAQKAQDREQAFHVSIDGGIHDHMYGDERRLQQILLHLLSNAVTFAPEGGKIELSAKMLEINENECLVRFEVSDDGIGIAPETLERLWEPFEQADNGITRRYGGMGIGLPLTKRIVDLMKGTLRVESEPGKGAHFVCEVRLGVVNTASQMEDETDQDRTECPDLIASEVDLTGKRILVVDDVEINRDILLALLEDTGAILDEAGDGEEAVRLFSQNEYDLVLMDLHMPGMDGFAATKSIRASTLPRAGTIPVISVSAESNSAEFKSRRREAGINDHIAKPVSEKKLLGILAKWMPA